MHTWLKKRDQRFLQHDGTHQLPHAILRRKVARGDEDEHYLRRRHVLGPTAEAQVIHCAHRSIRRVASAMLPVLLWAQCVNSEARTIKEDLQIWQHASETILDNSHLVLAMRPYTTSRGGGQETGGGQNNA